MSITTTAAQIAAAVNAKYPDLVHVTNAAGNDGTGVVTAMPVQRLTTSSAPTYPALWETTVNPAGAQNALVFRSVEGDATEDKKIGVTYVDTGRADEVLEVLLVDGKIIVVQLGTPAEPVGLVYATVDLAADTGYLNVETDLLTLTLTLGSGTRGKVLLQFDGLIGIGNGNQYANLRFSVDGVLQDNVATGLSYSNGIFITHSMHEVITGLAQGDHTFKVRISAPLNSVRAFAKGGDVATAQTRLTAIEL